MFNNSQVLYRNIGSTRVYIRGDLSVWTPKLCFFEIWRNLFKLKLRFSPTSIFTIKVNLTGFNSKAIAYIDPIIFCDENTNCVFQYDSWFVRYSSWIIIYVAKNMKIPEKNFYTKYELFPKIGLPWANAGTVFMRSHVCIIVKKKKRNWLYSFGVESEI